MYLNLTFENIVMISNTPVSLTKYEVVIAKRNPLTSQRQSYK